MRSQELAISCITQIGTVYMCREQTNEEKVVLLADSHDTLFQGGTLVCPSASTYADMYWNHEADVILQADGVITLITSS